MGEHMTGTDRYGWCLDGHHAACPRQNVENHPCGCPCHVNAPPPGACTWCGQTSPCTDCQKGPTQ